MKNFLVVKFGGSSLATIDLIKQCAFKVIDLTQMYHVVVVVSAMGQTTNYLLKQIEQAEIQEFPSTATDLILSTGENISAAFFAAALNELGANAHPMCGWQVPIITIDKHISNIDTDKINLLIDKDAIPVITGFQGVDLDGNITTLSRGGSDTTAAYLAYYLGAAECHIYTDVDGVYRVSPLVSDQPSTIHEISYEDMHKLASNGAKVIHPDAVEIAHRGKFDLHIKSSFRDASFTKVKSCNNKEYGVTCNKDGLIYILHNHLISENCLSDLISCLEEVQISPNELFGRVKPGKLEEFQQICSGLPASVCDALGKCAHPSSDISTSGNGYWGN